MTREQKGDERAKGPQLDLSPRTTVGRPGAFGRRKKPSRGAILSIAHPPEGSLGDP